MVLEDGRPDLDRIHAHLKANQLWKTGVKVFFAAHQHRRCAYCERHLTDHGDVEHFRPKAAIFQLKTAGRELESLNNVRGRNFHEAPHPGAHSSGYWWLAYDWDNYLLACGICNRTWKSALFPLQDGHRNAPSPGDERSERPLLLDPYGDIDPAEHLAFDEFGSIAPFEESARGRATIEVLGLDRLSITTSRREKAARTWRTLVKFDDAVERDDLKRLQELQADLLDLGEPTTVHAGMVRTMVTQTLGIPWEEVEALAQEF